MLYAKPAWHSLRHGHKDFCRRYLTAQVTQMGACVVANFFVLRKADA